MFLQAISKYVVSDFCFFLAKSNGLQNCAGIFFNVLCAISFVDRSDSKVQSQEKFIAQKKLTKAN